jgi:hypothetical protein
LIIENRKLCVKRLVKQRRKVGSSKVNTG